MTDPYVRPDVAAFLQFLNAQPPTDWAGTPIEQVRQLPVAMRHVADAETGELARMDDLTITGPAGDIPARLYDAREHRETGPIMVYFHGGGFCIGNLDTHDPWCAAVARQLDMPVIAVDYRLAPEHPYPAAPEDAEAATRWIASHMDCTGLVLSGDSAGGNLTVVVSLALARHPAAKPVIAQWPVYPAVAGGNGDWDSYRQFSEGYLLTNAAMDWFISSYAGRQEWQFAPLDEDLSAMPPAVVQTASLDPLRDQGRAYAAKLIGSGVRCTYIEAEGTIHGFVNLRKGIPSTDRDLADGCNALKGLLAELAPAA